MNCSTVYGYSERTLQALVQRAVVAQGDRAAIQTREETISYAELGQKTRGLAEFLMRHWDAVPSQPRLMALYGIQGAEPLVAIYASLLAGGGYVPLNPAFPPERTSFMLCDSSAPVVYIAGCGAENLMAFLECVPPGTTVIVSEAMLEVASSCPELHFVSTADWEDSTERVPLPAIPETACAYILYTSGSTGTPKGVMVSHGNVSYHVSQLVSLYGLQAEDRFSQTFDLTFDLSVIGIFGAIACGGCVCPIEKADKFSPAGYVKNRGITVWSSVPSVAVNMQKLRMLAPGCMPSVRLSIFCGEPLTVECARQWRQAACNSVVENTYGPTEATVLCTRFRWDAEAETRSYTNGIVPIGRPLPGTGLAIVDSDRRFIEDLPGELCIAGPQLSLGYTSAEQTARAFFEVFDVRFGVRQRWYKTGDLVKYHREGQWYEFLARVDSQVKVQGNRVELGEIESVLRTAYGCDAVVIVPYPVEDGSAKGLVAFLEQLAGAPDEETLRRACQRKLPSYMCPNRFVFVSEIPVNANGKYDRRTLYEECKVDER